MGLYGILPRVAVDPRGCLSVRGWDKAMSVGGGVLREGQCSLKMGAGEREAAAGVCFTAQGETAGLD